MEMTQEKKLINVSEPKAKAEQVFNSLDVSETTRKDYSSRIGLFLRLVEKDGFNRNTYLGFKRYLETRTDFTVATKNKYLATAKVFLKELNRLGVVPADITQNIKLFSQSKKHKREGLNEDEIALLSEKIRQMPSTARNVRLRAI